MDRRWASHIVRLRRRRYRREKSIELPLRADDEDLGGAKAMGVFIDGAVCEVSAHSGEKTEVDSVWYGPQPQKNGHGRAEQGYGDMICVLAPYGYSSLISSDPTAILRVSRD